MCLSSSKILPFLERVIDAWDVFEPICAISSGPHFSFSLNSVAHLSPLSQWRGGVQLSRGVLFFPFLYGDFRAKVPLEYRHFIYSCFLRRLCSLLAKLV